MSARAARGLVPPSTAQKGARRCVSINHVHLKHYDKNRTHTHRESSPQLNDTEESGRQCHSAPRSHAGPSGACEARVQAIALRRPRRGTRTVEHNVGWPRFERSHFKTIDFGSQLWRPSHHFGVQNCEFPRELRGRFSTAACRFSLIQSPGHEKTDQSGVDLQPGDCAGGPRSLSRGLMLMTDIRIALWMSCSSLSIGCCLARRRVCAGRS